MSTISKLTTPTFVFKFPEVISNYDEIEITFGTPKTPSVVTKHKADLVLDEGTYYSITLSEQETNLFNAGICLIQTRVRVGQAVSASKKYAYRIIASLSNTPFITTLEAD